MVLVDTSVWIDHFNHSDPLLERLLTEYRVVIHPYVFGELACGGLKKRQTVLDLLSNLPFIEAVDKAEFHHFVEHNRLFGLGLGFVDIHLLAACLVSHCRLYTKDKRLTATARSMKISQT